MLWFFNYIKCIELTCIFSGNRAKNKTCIFFSSIKKNVLIKSHFKVFAYLFTVFRKENFFTDLAGSFVSSNISCHNKQTNKQK